MILMMMDFFLYKLYDYNIDIEELKESDSPISIVIPEGVTAIGSKAFDSYTSMTDITIPSSVTSIGSRAFYHCPNLKDIILT